MIVEVSSHGSVIKRNHNLIVISNDEGKKEISAEKIDCIIVSSNSLISTQAVKLCIEKQIQLVLADYSGRPFARLWVTNPGRNTVIRRKQYQSENSELSFNIITEIVKIKINRQKSLLTYLKGNRDHEIQEINDAIGFLARSVEKLDQIKRDTEFKNNVLGIEGMCASYYFRAISESLPLQWRFNKRTKHPATDEFNAILNYVYGFGYSSMEKVIIISGLDPNAGFFHSDTYGKPTLSYDLLEIVRPLLDRLVVTLFTKKIVSDSWFEKQKVDDRVIGVYLSKEARKKVIDSYRQKYEKLIDKEGWNFCRKLIKLLSI